MANIVFTAEALDAMAERAISEEDVQKGLAQALENKTYIYSDDECIFRAQIDTMKVYGVFTHDGHAGEVPADVAEVVISTAYAHRILFTNEEDA